MLDFLKSDVLLALRGLRKTPGFTVVAILALALGIGANTAIFSGVSALLLGPMPYADPERLVAVWEDSSSVGFPRNTPAPANFVDWQRMNRVFTGMTALRFRVANLTGGGRPEVVLGRGVTPNFFEVLGVQPFLGRAFTPDEDSHGAKVTVISYGLWQRRFGGAKDVIGKTMLMNNEAVTLVGVMPPGFAFPDKQADYWDPAHFTPSDLARRRSHFLEVAARLKPGVSLAQARSDMQVIAKRLERAYPESNRSLGEVVIPLREQLVGDTRTAFLVLLTAAGLVLLIACANVANLLLTRGADRRRELAVRAALGATRGQLIRQLLVESVILSGAGAGAGVLFGVLAMDALQALIPPELVNASNLSLDLPILWFAIGLSLVSALLFGLVPALRSSRVDLNEVLKQGGRTVSGSSSGLRRAFVVGQVALALVLVMGAGLLIKTLTNLRGVDLGFPADHLLTMATPLSPQVYSTDPKILEFTNHATERISVLPGVRGAAFASDIPFSSIGDTNGFTIDGRAPSPDDEFNDALYREVSVNYLQVLGVRLLAGRLIDGRDTKEAPLAVVINETFARRYWPNSSAVGGRIRLSSSDRTVPIRTVVGVIADVRERGLQLDLKPAMYLPFSQVQQPSASYLIVRTAEDPNSLINPIRSAMWSVDPEQPMALIRTMDEYIERGVRDRSHQMKVLEIFAGLALFLAGLGIYGVLAFSVVQRRREIGIRRALGATSANVTGMILRNGLGLAVAGLIVGAFLAAASTRAMESLLFGVKPIDPVSMSVAAAIMLLSATAACLIPTLTAARVDPSAVLRDE
jgi:putative ABC transport system permease protein